MRARYVAAGAGALALLALAVPLERRLGRSYPSPLAAAAGLAAGIAGAALFVRARLALGERWQASALAPASVPLVRRGPYACIRHPLYAAGLLLAAATPLLHPSLAALLVGTGFAAGTLLKLRIEERTLRSSLGADYERYAREVPALFPRLCRRQGPERGGG